MTAAHRRRGLQPEVLVVAALVIAALLLRLRQYSGSLFADELSAFYITTGHTLRGVVHILYGHSVDLNPPLYFVGAWVAQKVAGHSAEMLRLVSLVAGLATVPLTYLLGRWSFNRATGYLAAAVVTLSPFMIFYSTEARPYALLTALVLTSTLVLMQAVGRDRWTWWLAYALSSAAAVYTQYTSVFPLVAMFVWAFLTQRQVRWRLGGSAALAAVLFLPWLPALIDNTQSPGKYIIQALEPFRLRAVGLDLNHLVIGHPYLPLSKVPGIASIALVLAAVLVAAIGLAWRIPGVRTPAVRTKSATDEARTPAPAILLLLAAPVGIGIYSALTTSVWDRRNLISAWPGFAVTAAALALSGRRLWRAAGAALLLASFVIGAARMQRTSTQRPNYAAVAAYVARQGQPGDPVADFDYFTPGPPNETEAALALGPGTAPQHPVLRVGQPPLDAVLSAPPYALLPAQPGPTVAGQVLSLARRGRVFLVVPGAVTGSQLERIARGERSGVVSLVEQAFLRTLLPRVQLRRREDFRGFADVSVLQFAVRR